MDANGNNRYQLLFTDDESMPAPVAKEPAKTNDGAIKNNIKKKGAANNEKENKSNAMNKNVNKKQNVAGEKKEKPLNTIGNKHNNDQKNVRSSGGVEGGRPRYSGDHQQQQQNGPSEDRRDGNRRGWNNRYRNGDRFGKREFDRQSGSDRTGVKSIDKRDGAGAHNWGSIKQEIDDIDKSNAELDASGTEKEENTENAAETNAVPVEEEAKEMTLDEWKALNKTRSKPQYNLRKAGEGEDTSQWKKMIVLNKKENADSEEEYEFDPSLYPQRVGRLQRITDIKFNFNDGRRGMGRGRGRGIGREREFRNNDNRGDKPVRKFNNRSAQKDADTNLLKVDDENQFPTLG